MKPIHTLIVWYIVSNLLVIDSTKSRAQSFGDMLNSSGTNISLSNLAQLQQKMEAMSSTDLLTAAEAGNAQAEYFYGIQEWNHASEDSDQAYDREMEVYNRMSFSEKTAAQTKWGNASLIELEQAAAGGDLIAQYYLSGKEDPFAKQGKKAFEWLKKSAGQGFAPAEYEVAIRDLWSINWSIIEVNQPEGLKFLQSAADHGWPPAQYKLGMYLVVGELLPRNLSEVLSYLQKAADQGDRRAQYLLAQLYAQGVGEPRSTGDSPIALLRKSADSGFYLALQALAERYRIGLGAPVDYIQAVRYYQAARDADENAATVPAEYRKDVFHLVDANDQPNPEAGPVWSDFALVLSTYLKATVQADGDAMSQLGDWYLTGHFTPQDSIVAYHWYCLAADHGTAKAAEKRNALMATLRPDQLEKAEKLHESIP